jgi:hypothetical protein
VSVFEIHRVFCIDVKYLMLNASESNIINLFTLQGVEATMRLLFDKDAGKENGSSGMLYAMNKEKTKLLFSDINKMPQKQ